MSEKLTAKRVLCIRGRTFIHACARF